MLPISWLNPITQVVLRNSYSLVYNRFQFDLDRFSVYWLVLWPHDPPAQLPVQSVLCCSTRRTCFHFFDDINVSNAKSMAFVSVRTRGLQVFHRIGQYIIIKSCTYSFLIFLDIWEWVHNELCIVFFVRINRFRCMMYIVCVKASVYMWFFSHAYSLLSSTMKAIIWKHLLFLLICTMLAEWKHYSLMLLDFQTCFCFIACISFCNPAFSLPVGVIIGLVYCHVCADMCVW